MEEDDIKKKFEEVNKKLNNPKISKKVDDYLKKISALVDCNVELNFSISPHGEDYSEIQDSEDYIIPEETTMTLIEFIDHIVGKETDNDLKIYIDPIYLKKGVNEIVDLLITTLDDRIILVPISNNKQFKI